VKSSPRTYALIAVSTLAVLAAATVAINATQRSTVHPSASTKSVILPENKGTDVHYCNGCTPPLTNSGGAVVNTTGAAGFTITPIFWAPAGSSPANTFPATYQSIISGYIANVAAASGTTSNVYSIATEYYSLINGVKTPITYKITAGTPIVDTSPLPASGCTPNMANGYTSCITDLQLRAELTKVTTANSLPTDLAHFYPVFSPPNTETQGVGGASGGNSDADYCGYHSAFGSGTSEIVYGNEPYETSGCDGGESPNGLLIADGAIGVLSHEVSETMTDPEGSGINSGPAWGDSTGHEIGDECSGFYGPPLGSTNASSPMTTAYNQLINGGKYYTQNEFSNAAFAKLGIGNGCQPSEAAATGMVANVAQQTSTAVGSVTSDAFPNTLPNDGKSTSVIDITVADHANFAVVGDRVNYSIYAVTGPGYCGSLSATFATTDSGGHADVTYTASRGNVVCAVVATEVEGGQGATGTVYQGTYQASAPTAGQDFPKKLTVGGGVSTFDITYSNPAKTPIYDARIQFGIFAGDNATDNVKASQVTLSYSTTGKDGKFLPVHLSGSSIKDGEIQGIALPMAGVVLGPDSTEIIYFHISLASSISTAGGGAGLAFEAYLDQIDPASGALSTFADTLAYQVKVLPAS